MTTRVGIIEWLDNTKPIKSILEEQLNKTTPCKRNEPPLNIQTMEAAKMHQEWIKEIIEKKGSAQEKRGNFCLTPIRAKLGLIFSN